MSDAQAPTFVWPIGPNHHVAIETSHLFPVTPYTLFLLKHLPDVSGKDVMDFGIGSGIAAVVAARLGARSVLGCDVSIQALELAQRNAHRNDVRVLTTLLVTPDDAASGVAPDSVDVIVCNPASLPTLVPADGFWSGGPLGNH